MGWLNNLGQWISATGEKIANYGSEDRIGVHAEKLVQLAINGSIPFKPYTDIKEGETATMRAAYRGMTKEPVVRACLDTLIQGISSLDLETTPTDESPQAQEEANFCNDLITNSDEGIVGVAEAILSGGFIEGYSVCEPVWNEPGHSKGAWKDKRTLKILKPKPTDIYWLNVDKFLNVVGIKSTLTGDDFSPDEFLHFRNQPTFNYPTGTSVLRPCYRAGWMLDTSWKFRAIALERYTLPLLVGRYPQGRTSVQRALYEALKKARGAGVLTIPDEAMVEAITLAARGTADYKDSISDLNESVAMAILGGSLQTLVGYGAQRGDTGVHEAQSELRKWRGSVALCQAIKNGLYKPAMLHNYGPDRPVPTPTLGGVNDGEIIKGLEIDERMARLGWKLSKIELGKRTRRTWAKGTEDELQPPQSSVPPAMDLGNLGKALPNDGSSFSERGGISNMLMRTFRRTQ